MAKVWGPLHSDDARGKFAKALVFIGWKGIKDCRQWLKPANPQSTGQGDIRNILGGIGRAVGIVDKESSYHEKLKTNNLIPDKQSKQSYVVQYIKDNYIYGGGTTLTGNFASVLSTFTGHTSYAAFNTKAGNEGLVDLSIDYSSVDTFEKGLGLYLLAKAGIDFDFAGSPYDVSLSTWSATQISALTGHLNA